MQINNAFQGTANCGERLLNKHHTDNTRNGQASQRQEPTFGVATAIGEAHTQFHPASEETAVPVVES